MIAASFLMPLWVRLIPNKLKFEDYIDDAYDSLSVNGFMTDYSFSGQELADGESAALVIQLWESSLEENQIASVAEVQEIEMGFEIKEGYTTIDEPTVTMAFE